MSSPGARVDSLDVGKVRVLPGGHRGAPARIEAVNPALNALVSATDPQRCLDAADEADNCAARGDPLGKAHGLPVVIKDLIRVAGLACSGGSPVLRSVARDYATALSRLRAEGAIVLGLTNVPYPRRGADSSPSTSTASRC